MRLEQLRLFLAIAKAGSISAASRETGLAQPALSVQMRQLEQSLAVRLFDRSVHGVRLTEAGQRLLPRADAVLRHAAQVREEVRNAEGAPSGQVTVALSKSLVPILAGDLFWQAQHRYPLIELQITDPSFPDSSRMIETGAVDFGLLPNALAMEKVTAEPVLAQDLYLIGPRSELTREAGPRHTERQGGDTKGDEACVEFAELRHHRLVMGGPSNQLRIELENLAAKAGFALDIAYEQDAVAVYHEIVRSGPVSTVVPYSTFAHDIESGVLAGRRIVNPTPERVTCFVWNRELSNAATTIRDLMADLILQAIAQGRLRGHALLSEARPNLR
ncbi:LysR family transcriptional regulator [Consotaella aegiceratis]|uniref:LysR family transcriptional regulator n=1 Tax=Consotaella aegiceratis TaxID=3097961 RepID=UPI002F3F4619